MIRKARICSAAATLVVVVACATAIAAPDAQAGFVGRSAPAEVTCDYMTNQIKIQAVIGASESYDTQRVAYELYLYNASTSKWLKLDLDGQTWDVRVHERVTWGSPEWSIMDNAWIRSGPWISTLAPTPTRTVTVPDGRYYVYTRYVWEAGMNSGIWYDANGARFTDSSPWSRTTSYSWWGYGGYFSHCSL